MRYTWAGAVGLALLLPALAAPDEPKPVKPIPPADLAIGKVAPDIEGDDLDGKKFKLSDYRGKVVVLDFWGNW